jgi:glutathione S-transferase
MTRRICLDDAEKLLKLLMENKGDSAWLAGPAPSLADYFLGPILFYISLTPDAERLLAVPGVAEWWEAMQQVQSFKSTEPDLG